MEGIDALSLPIAFLMVLTRTITSLGLITVLFRRECLSQNLDLRLR
jgi:hypothetical protein